MKKAIILLLSVMVIASCNTPEEITPNEITNNQLQGVWKSESHIHNGTNIVNPLTIKFDAISTTTGHTNWNCTIANNRDTTVVYDYEVIDNGTSINIEGNILSASFLESKLVLEGVVENYQSVITLIKE